MSPFPAILALGNTRVHVHSPDSCDVVTNIEAPVDKHFSILSTLYVPYINLDNGHVGFWRDFDNSWSGREGNIVEDMIFFEDGFDI